MYISCVLLVRLWAEILELLIGRWSHVSFRWLTRFQPSKVPSTIYRSFKQDPSKWFSTWCFHPVSKNTFPPILWGENSKSFKNISLEHIFSPVLLENLPLWKLQIIFWYSGYQNHQPLTVHFGWPRKSLPSHDEKSQICLLHETFHCAAEGLSRSHRAAWRGRWFEQTSHVLAKHICNKAFVSCIHFYLQ